MNPCLTPSADITPDSDWSKIIFNEIEFLCVSTPLSPSGEGANISQYYIVENAYNTLKPIIHYYFFNQVIMPISNTD